MLGKDEKSSVVKPLTSASPSGLNKTQENIIEGTIQLYLDDIMALPPQDAQKILSLMLTTEKISNDDLEQFKKWDVLVSIEFIRGIIAHPCPQNRTTNYPYFGAPEDPDMIVFKDSEGKKAFEKKGLLSLSAKNDKTAPPVTKKAVVDYLSLLIKKEIDNSLTGQPYWKNKLLSDPSCSLMMNKIIAIDAISDYRHLYQVYNQISRFKEVNQLWQMLLLSGEKKAIDYVVKSYGALESKYPDSHIDGTAFFIGASGRIDGIEYGIKTIKFRDDKLDENALLDGASLAGAWEALKYLTVTKKIKDNLANTPGQTNTLHRVTVAGSVDSMQHAVEYMRINPLFPNYHEESLLHLAVRSQKVEVVRYAAKLLNNKISSNKEGMTPLHIAASRPSIEILNLLVKEYRCDIHAKDIYKRNILHCAALAGLPDMMKHIVEEYKLDPHEKSGLNNLLDFALESEEIAAVKCALKFGVSLPADYKYNQNEVRFFKKSNEKNQLLDKAIEEVLDEAVMEIHNELIKNEVYPPHYTKIVYIVESTAHALLLLKAGMLNKENLKFLMQPSNIKFSNELRGLLTGTLSDQPEKRKLLMEIPNFAEMVALAGKDASVKDLVENILNTSPSAVKK